jgi:hypothetical protein
MATRVALWRTEWSSRASRSRSRRAREASSSRHGQGEAAGRKSGGGRSRQDGGRQGLTLDVKAGDRLLFGKYAGTEIKLDGEAGHSSLLVRARARERFPLGPDSPSSSAARRRSVHR